MHMAGLRVEALNPQLKRSPHQILSAHRQASARRIPAKCAATRVSREFRKTLRILQLELAIREEGKTHNTRPVLKIHLPSARWRECQSGISRCAWRRVGRPIDVLHYLSDHAQDDHGGSR